MGGISNGVDTFLVFPQFLLRVLARGDVAHESEDDSLTRVLNHAGGDLNGYEVPFFVDQLNLIRAGGLALHISLEQLGGFVQALFRQDIQLQKVFTNYLFTLVTDDLFALAVAVNEVALIVAYVDAIRGILQVVFE